MTISFLETPLGALAEAAGDLCVEMRGDPSTVVRGLAYDSRRVAPGELFFCVRGLRSDGHRFATQATAAGAAALCVEVPTGAGVPELVVSDVRAAMPLISARALGHPADDLVLLGVTGTNGKTTTAYLIESILRADGRTTGLVGTIETRIADERRAGVRTTPESLDLQSLLYEMRAAEVDSVAMEVTSHALVLNRVDAIRFTAAAFTNLTQDHLDFHSDMGAYFEAKRSLFTPQRTEKSAVNLDDPYGQKIFEEAAVPVLGFGSVPGADVRAEDVDMHPSGSRFRMITPKGDTAIDTPLVGPFNVSNCLAAAAVALQAGIGLEAIDAGIRSLRAVPGRFEAVDVGQPFSVIVDYAHTPDSLENVLVAARRMAASSGGDLVCVFGCGGDRDRAKRPLMGSVAARVADKVIVTSDNPRSEPPEAIVGEIVSGIDAVRAAGADLIEVDRRAAIEIALEGAGEHDVILIAGKGHETGQEFADHTIPFDDRVVAAEILGRLGWGDGS